MNNFIYLDYLQDLTLCDDIIAFHKNCDDKSPGEIGGANGKGVVNKKCKDSTDVALDPKLQAAYINALQYVTEKYIKEYPYCNCYAPWTVKESINVQHYAPKGGYFDNHCERTDAIHPVNNRHLVFMTYLNDMSDAGETEFVNQNIKITPKKGLTVIWPADWTHTHRGISSPTQEKYIVTGWYSYV